MFHGRQTIALTDDPNLSVLKKKKEEEDEFTIEG